MVLAELQVMEKSAAPKKPVHPRRQHTARPIPIPVPYEHSVRHVGQLVKETPSLGFPAPDAAAAAAVQRTPQYLEGLNIASGAPGSTISYLEEGQRMLRGMPRQLDPQNPLLHALLPSAAGQQFGRTGNFTPVMKSKPKGGRSDISDMPMKFRNLSRAMARAGVR